MNTSRDGQSKRDATIRFFCLLFFDINVLNTVDPNNHCTGQSFNCNFWLSEPLNTLMRNFNPCEEIEEKD